MDPSLARRRQLRTNSTEPELILWGYLRAHRFAGFKFRRQHPCGPYILDFFCAARELAVELDGGQHFGPDALDYDVRQTRYLIARGITVLRFQNDWVFHELQGILAVIAAALGVEDLSP